MRREKHRIGREFIFTLILLPRQKYPIHSGFDQS